MQRDIKVADGEEIVVSVKRKSGGAGRYSVRVWVPDEIRETVTVRIETELIESSSPRGACKT